MTAQPHAFSTRKDMWHRRRNHRSLHHASVSLEFLSSVESLPFVSEAFTCLNLSSTANALNAGDCGQRSRPSQFTQPRADQYVRDQFPERPVEDDDRPFLSRSPSVAFAAGYKTLPRLFGGFRTTGATT